MTILSRRRFLQLGLAGCGAAAFAHTALAVQDTSSDIRLEHVAVKVPNLPAAFAHFRIGFITDIHVGPFVPDEWIARSRELLAPAKVDLLLFGGDFISVPEYRLGLVVGGQRNESIAKLSPRAQGVAVFKRLSKVLTGCSAPEGAYGVYGNHDRWLGPKACGESLTEAGIRLLVNEDVLIRRGAETLRLTGVDDYWTGQPRLVLPARAPDSKEVRVVLAHNPDYIGDIMAPRGDDYDLALSGHTHGGQIRLPFFGAPVCNVLHKRLFAGLNDCGKGQVYTSRGLGVVEIPYRFNCPAEVTVLELLMA